MQEPMQLQDLFISTLAGAAIVVFGAFYALFYALGQLHRSRTFSLTAFLCYGFLTLAVYFLVTSLNLSGFWLVVCGVMVLGYFVAPRMIWHLCVATHDHTDNPAKTQSDFSTSIR